MERFREFFTRGLRKTQLEKMTYMATAMREGICFYEN